MTAKIVKVRHMKIFISITLFSFCVEYPYSDIHDFIQDFPKPTHNDGIWTGFKMNQPEAYYQIGARFINKIKENPQVIGQIDGRTGASETFGSIYNKSVRCALWLKKYGIGRNDVVAYCAENNMNTCIPFLASFYIGSIFNPWWDYGLDEEVVKFFIESTKPKVLFANEQSARIALKVVKNIDYDLKIIVFEKILGFETITDTLNKASIDEVQTFECTNINNFEEPALIMYTSGTSNNPKGVLHSYGSMASMIGPISNTKYTTLWFANLCWLSGILSIVYWILTQSTAIIYDSPSEIVACQLIDKFKVTRLTMGTAAANRLSKLEEIKKYDVSTVKFLAFAGSVTKENVVEFLMMTFKNAFIITAYGSTECMGTVGMVNPNKLISSGRVAANHEIKVVDLETNEVLGSNKEGELCCRGTTLMKCYWNDPQATNEIIDSDGWYHTGDIGYYDEDGDFFIIERIKEIIKYRLTHVTPAVIEGVIHNIPGVAEVAVVAKPHMEDLEQPTAFITTIPGARITEEEIHKVVEEKLDDRMKLRGGVYFLEKMPYTASKKISKRELRALARAQAKW